MASTDLPDLIKQTAARVRGRDFIWSLSIAAGILLVIEFSGLTITPWLAPAAWVAFVGSLYFRYRFSSERDWAEPVERLVETEIRSQKAELEALRLARGLAQALPEPVFVLDRDGLIEFSNPAAEDFVDGAKLAGRHFATVLRASTVYDAFEEVIAGATSQVIDFTSAGPVERHSRAFIAPLAEEANEGETPSRALIYIRDLTSEKRVENMRVDFIASASHELRTPLASLLGFIETMRGPAKEDYAAHDRFLSIMQSQAERMQRLVSDLMSLSQIELNEHVRPRSKVDLPATLQEVVDGLEPLLAASESTVSVDYESSGSVIVEGDKDQLFQAMQNLVENALKYGGEAAEVHVSVGVGDAPLLSADDQTEVFRVGDTASQFAARNRVGIDRVAFVQVGDRGPGIPRASIPRLTERFYRVDVEGSKKAGGTGLGLAIVKHVVNRHKGALWIQSAQGVGASFTCYFVAAPAGETERGDEAESVLASLDV
ncbi:MAG: ATP-binding protein [Pseudomonadota bacterium]